MSERVHGTRRCYSSDRCRCESCQAANTRYQASYRELKKHGKLALGAKISGKQAWRIVSHLLAERFTKARIAKELGLTAPMLQFDHRVVTLKNTLKLRRLAKRYLQ